MRIGLIVAVLAPAISYALGRLFDLPPGGDRGAAGRIQQLVSHLEGPGWYRRKAEALDGPADLGVSTTEFGWHAGIGLEILPIRGLREPPPNRLQRRVPRR